MSDTAGKSKSDAFHDVEKYSSDFLRIIDGRVQVPVTYKKIWDDGFGARGWKVNATIGDPTIIASNRETGQRINTSVFIHDILDHFLSGFGVSGHRSEAMALVQLAKRTGSDPGSDYEQIIREDLIHGRINGESFNTFLSDRFITLLPKGNKMSDSEIMLFLNNEMGEPALVEALVDQFFTIGMRGEAHALTSYEKLGLDSCKRKQLGIALQELLQIVDEKAEESGVETLEALITVNNNECSFTINPVDSELSESIFYINVA